MDGHNDGDDDDDDDGDDDGDDDDDNLGEAGVATEISTGSSLSMLLLTT